MRSAWFAFCFLAASLMPTCASAYHVELTQDQLQERVAKRFPHQQETALGIVTLSDPRVVLTPDSPRIGLEVTIKVETVGAVAGSGRGLLDGEIEYRPEAGEFYLRDPRLPALSFDGVPPEYGKVVQAIADAALRQALPVVMIHRLDLQDTRQNFAKSMLRSVTVNGGKLILEMDLF